MSTELSWIPVRRGNIYCSPACGGNCTYEQYAEALSKANKCAEELGEEWTVHVMENLGWYSYVSSGPVTVHCGSDGTFSCSVANKITDEPCVWDEGYWHDSGTGDYKTPGSALSAKAAAVQEFLSHTKYVENLITKLAAQAVGSSVKSLSGDSKMTTNQDAKMKINPKIQPADRTGKGGKQPSTSAGKSSKKGK